MRLPRQSGRVRWMLAAVLTALSLTSAYAAPIDPGGGTPGQQLALACLDQTITTFTARDPIIQLYGNTTLSWTVHVPGNCTTIIRQLYLDGVHVAFSGTREVNPLTSGDFALTTPIPTGTATLGTVHVTVQLPTVVDISDSTPAWRSLLIEALTQPSTPPRTVRLWPNVDMDMGVYAAILVAPGVTLVGGQPCPAPANARLASVSSTTLAAATLGPQLCGGRDAQHAGPRLYTTLRPHHLFELSDNVRFSGFRLQGPHWDPVDDDDTREVGILIQGRVGIDISDMEISGWCGAGIRDTNEGLPPASLGNSVHVHDNFIHHNQHIGDDGYGVDVSHGAYALIERNVFDFNRHGVTVGKPDYPHGGYNANNNLVLKGGGLHGKIYENWTQQFDVHGDQNCGPPLFNALWNCGNSADLIFVTANAFQYTNGLSFKLRGTPAGAAYVYRNVFPKSESDSVHDNVTGMLLGHGDQANVFNVDTYGHYGVCDFDGDGKDDLFLPTGVTWWTMSGANRQWVFQRASDLTLDQVALGDFDGDGRCDVLAAQGTELGIYSGGTSDWKSLHIAAIPFDQLRIGHFSGSTRPDIFRRAPTGQWSIVAATGSTPLASSPLPLSQLHFGDFDGDHITDVLAMVDGHWSVSWGGRTAFAPLNTTISDSLDSVLIADVDGNGADDVLRLQGDSLGHGLVQVSWGGRSAWQPLATFVWPPALAGLSDANVANPVFGVVGRFNGQPGTQLVVVDDTRVGKIFSRSAGALVPFAEYAY